jgi:hypothetical protein
VQQHLIEQFDEFAFDRFDLLAVQIRHWRLRSHINSITVYCACNASL